MPAVLQDYSPIRIGASGTDRGRGFTVAGRLQLRYAAGLASEWYLLYDDGRAGWLGDFGGTYTLTGARAAEGPLPPMADIHPGRSYVIAGTAYTAAEVRSGECVSAQGELPFRVGSGWRVQAADFRSGDDFATLDYTDGPGPCLYAGRVVKLKELALQHLWDDAQISSASGKFRGRVNALTCPGCSASLNYVPGAAVHLICPACQADLDATGQDIQQLRKRPRINAVPTSLELGASALMQGRRFTVIGILRRASTRYGDWSEYLLSANGGVFTWLVETGDGWSQANVLSSWPVWTALDADSVLVKRSRYARTADYEARVVFAIGAFNWRVVPGERVRVVEFEKDTATLAAELDAGGLTWSRSTPLAYDQMQAWFGGQYHGAVPVRRGGWFNTRGLMGTARIFTIVMLVLNAIPLLANFAGNWNIVLIGAGALLLPAWFLDLGKKDE
jgi:hypothetical protein